MGVHKMAERRMFAKSIINSARFLRMPATSRLLYYDLGMAADDDGVVEAFAVMRMTGAVEDDLRVLVTKGFVTILDEDELVAYINDWSVSNQLRADRKIDSVYQELLLKIVPDAQIIQKTERADRRRKTGRPADNQGTNNGRPADNQGTEEDSIGKDRLDKGSLDKDNIGYSGAEPEQEKNRIYSLELIDGSLFPIYQDDIDKWSSAYPAVDVMAQLRRMDAWLASNPKRRKTKNGVKRFINRWLSDEQDKGGVYRGNHARQSPAPQGYSNPDDIDISGVF